MTMTEKRTDIHRPSAPEFDPENYTCFGVFDLFPEWPTTDRQRTVSGLVAQGWRFTSPHGMGQCGHCGARIRYAALMGHEPTKGMIYVGETCLDNRFEMTQAEFQTLRKAAALNRERSAKRDRIAAALVEMPELVWASYAHNIEVAGAEFTYTTAYSYGEVEFATQAEADTWLAGRPSHHNDYVIQGTKVGTTWAEKTRMGDKTSILSDMWSRFERTGEISDKAYAFLVKIVGWMTEAEERRAAREAAKAQQVEAGGVVTEGRQVLEGEIVKIAWKSNDFGGAWKITVTLTNGAKVWGSLPSSLETFDWDEEQSVVGKRLRFTATVEAGTDPTFGFFKRPAKAEWLDN